MNKIRGKVYVWGQVRNQGAVDLLFNQKLTVSKAILMGGGFGDFANRKNVKVIRGKKTIEVNMVDVLEHNKTEEDVLLEPDDSVVVERRAVNF